MSHRIAFAAYVVRWSALAAVALLGCAYLLRPTPPTVVVLAEHPAPETMPLVSPPVITITTEQILYQGVLIATVASALRDSSPSFSIDAVTESLLARDVRTRGCIVSAHPGVAALCPQRLVLVEMLAPVDPRLFNRLLHSTQRAGFHAIVAPSLTGYVGSF